MCQEKKKMHKRMQHFSLNTFFPLSPFSFVDINNDVFILLYMKMVTILLAYITG